MPGYVVVAPVLDHQRQAFSGVPSLLGGGTATDNLGHPEPIAVVTVDRTGARAGISDQMIFLVPNEAGHVSVEVGLSQSVAVGVVLEVIARDLNAARGHDRTGQLVAIVVAQGLHVGGPGG